MVFKKDGRKTSPPNKLYKKRAPRGGPQMSSRPFCGRQTSENVVFCEWGDFGNMRILHSSAVLGRTPPTKYSQGFLELSRGGQKTRKNQGFWLSHVRVFFPFRLLMVTCRLNIPSCLQMCHSSLLSYCCCYVFLLSGGCVSLFLFIFIFVVLFTFHLVVCLCCLLSWCDRNPDQITKNLKFWLSSSASVPASPHFHLAQIITLLGQEKNLSKNLFFVALILGLLAVCWNTYFYCVFTHHPKFAYKMGPNKNDTVSQNAKQESVF